jgi:16S rRNA (cytidine1402-2'-O)-methyltransferase
MKPKGRLYLIPGFIGDTDVNMAFPPANREIVALLRHFFVENPKPARQLLKKIHPAIVFDDVQLYTHDKHARSQEQAEDFIRQLLNGEDGGLLSDAGCPGVADPGSDVVRLAHRHGIRIVPLVGPSSLILTLMASGLNGQHFTFTGYLPKDRGQRIHELRKMAQTILRERNTFLFIETPYRAHHLLEDILAELPGQIILCTGTDLQTSRQQIISRTLAEWKSAPPVALQEKLVVFALGI